jgi:hypothetical protein
LQSIIDGPLFFAVFLTFCVGAEPDNGFWDHFCECLLVFGLGYVVFGQIFSTSHKFCASLN